MHFYNIPESNQEMNEKCVQKVKRVLSDLNFEYHYELIMELQRLWPLTQSNPKNATMSLSANTIMAELTNRFQQTRLKTSSTDKQYSLNSEDDFRSSCQNISDQQQFFSELHVASPGWSQNKNYWYSWVQTIYFISGYYAKHPRETTSTLILYVQSCDIIHAHNVPVSWLYVVWMELILDYTDRMVSHAKYNQ